MKTRYAFVASCLLTSTAMAESSSGDLEVARWAITAGVFDLTGDTQVRVDASDLDLGTLVNVEEFLQVEDSQRTAFLSARYRMAERHFVELEYFDVGRNGRTIIDADFSFEDTIYNVGADLSSRIGTRVYRLGYAYRLLHQDRFLLAASAGVHVTEFDMSVTANASSGGSSASGTAEFADITAPLPVFGLSGGYQLSDKLSIVARAQIFRLKVGNIDGALDHALFLVEHDTFENIGFGIGYDYFEIDVESNGSDLTGQLDVVLEGPRIFVKGRF